MSGGRVGRRSFASLGLALVTALGTGCSSDPAEPVTTAAWVEDGPPAYCSGQGGEDSGFWTIVHRSCAVAQDGDVFQARALRRVLLDLDTDEVADFHRTFVRLNKGLRPAAEVADDICAPGLGLGDDLGTDYRSWVIAHGQEAYEAVVADPERLRDFPDATAGCGRGEPYGAVALLLHLERTGLDPAHSGLPVLEDQ